MVRVLFAVWFGWTIVSTAGAEEIGGVTPDVKLEPKKVSPLLKALKKEYIIFK